MVWLHRGARWEGRRVVGGLKRAWEVEFAIVSVLRGGEVCVCVFQLGGGLCVVRLSDFEGDLNVLVEVHLLS